MDPTDASTVSIATRTTTSYALTFASWKETEKWDGRSMGKKAFKEKFERAIRREPEMMAMWTGGFTEYTAANFVNVQHEFAKERIKQQLKAAGWDTASIVVATGAACEICGRRIRAQAQWPVSERACPARERMCRAPSCGASIVRRVPPAPSE